MWRLHALIFLLLFTQLTPSNALAISETNFDTVYDTLVAPHYEQAGVSGEFAGTQGIPIRYRVFEVPKEAGAILIVSGRTESYAQYAEAIYDLNQAQYSVYILDHRGQGFSGRMTADSEVGYVDDFADYVADLSYFVDHAFNAKPHAHRYLLAKSMGGAIAELYLADHPGNFDRAALISPMFEVNTSPYPEVIAYDYASLNCWFGKGEEFAPSQGPFDPNLGFEQNQYTSSPIRYRRNLLIQDENPKIQLGGASNRWVVRAIEADWKISQLAAQIELPTLLFQAGRDQIVRPGGQDRFCGNAPHCMMIAVPESQHDMLLERDFIREPVLSDIIGFFQVDKRR